MNAPSTLPPGYMADQKIEWTPVLSIAPSETNMQQLRRSRLTDDSLQEMAASIRADGIHQPIIIRPLPALRDLAKFELVAGERRWRAAQLAGLEHVPAVLRELTDEQVIRAQLTENIQRQTLTELEEAEGYRELIAAEKTTAEGIVDIVGRRKTTIYDRLKLLELPAEGRLALIEGRLDASLALPVARVHHRLQAKALAIALRPGMTVRELKSRLSGPGFTASLTGAGFPLDDAELFPEAGPCTTCPNRIANCGEFDPAEDDPDVCMKPECFEVKVYRQNDRARAAFEVSGAHILTGAAALEIAPKKDILVDHVDLDQVCTEDEQGRTYRNLFNEALEEKEALNQVVIEDPRDHRIRELVPVDRARRLLKRRGIVLPNFDEEPEAPASAPVKSAEDQERQEAERQRKQREQQERTEAEVAYRHALLKAVYRKATGPLKDEDLLAIVDLVDGPGLHAMAQLLGQSGGSAHARQLAERMKGNELARFVRCALVAQCVNFPEQHPGELIAMARRYRIDPAAVRKGLTADKKPARTRDFDRDERTAAKAPKKSAAKKKAKRK